MADARFYKGKETPYNLSQDLWDSAGCVFRNFSGKHLLVLKTDKLLGQLLEWGIKYKNQNAVLNGVV